MIKHLKHIFLFVGFIAIASKTNANIDSLFLELNKVKHDTNKANILNNISESLWKSNHYDSAKVFSQQALLLSQQLKFKSGIGSAYNTQGAINLYQGNYAEAIRLFNISLTFRQALNDKKGIASSYNNIGNAYVFLGNYPLALKNYLQSLKIKEEIGDLKGVAATYNNIGAIYENQKNYTEAEKKYLQSLKIKQQLNDEKGIGSTYLNLGNIYVTLNNLNQALDYFNKSLIIKQQLNDVKGIADIYHNIGSVYEMQSKHKEALSNYLQSYQIRKEINDKKGLSSSSLNLSSYYYSLKNYKEARKYIKQALDLSIEIDSKERISKSYESLAKIDSIEGKYKNAYLNYYKFISYRDSLINEDNTKRIIEQQMQFEFDKKSVADSLLFEKEKGIKEVEIAKQKTELKAKRNQQIALYGGLLLVLVFAGFMYNRFKVTQKQKTVIEQQKDVVEKAHLLLEEKNSEIIASIRYAKRIQDSLLTSQKYIERNINRLKNTK